MIVRRLLWIVVPMLLLVVLAGGGTLAWLLLRSPSQPARLVVLGPNKQVRLLDTSGAERVLAANAKTDGFSFPATAPDQRHLAYVTEDDSGAAIVLLDVVSGERKEGYHSRESLPFDLAWSPDGKYLVFLAGEQLTAQIVPADGSVPAHMIAAGAPSYFAWSPDSGTLLLHLGGHTGRIGQVEDGFALIVEQHAGVVGGQKAAAPRARPRDRPAFRDQHDVAGQIGRLAPQPVSDPSAGTRPAGRLDPRAEHDLRGRMVELIRVHRANESEFVRAGTHVRQQLRHLHAALAVSAVWELAAHEP
jgi:dipeptidyl aminopeptidase/acylaminoacyl peptidase